MATACAICAAVPDRRCFSCMDCWDTLSPGDFALPLAEKATVYAVDMPGVGFSDRPPNAIGSFRAQPNVCCVFLTASASTPAICWGRLMAARRHDGGGPGAGAGTEPDSGRSGEPLVGPRQAAGALSQQRARFVAAPALRTVSGNSSRRACCDGFTEIPGGFVPVRSPAIRQPSKFPVL